MKHIFSVMMILATLVCIDSAATAAELLDVKPVVAGSTVSVEISADVAMTYTYYKVPGQPRAVVDIAEADPEKVEPLIVVNKGAVSSISVDKAEISGIVVSRIIFNLLSEAEISVTPSPDRKILTVSFGDIPAVKPEVKTESRTQPLPEAVVKAETTAPIVADVPATNSVKEEDPLGLDEPVATSVSPTKDIPSAIAITAASGAAIQTAPTQMRIPKLEPVVPAAAAPKRYSALSILDIATGASFIEIRTNQTVSKYKAAKLTAPDRVFIDIAGEITDQKPKSVAINKFGISKARIGVSPKNIRIVFDSEKSGFPKHTISSIEDGIRLNFQ